MTTMHDVHISMNLVSWLSGKNKKLRKKGILGLKCKTIAFQIDFLLFPFLVHQEIKVSLCPFVCLSACLLQKYLSGFYALLA